jgi:two-component system, LuxR family, sensor kinase FixL
MNRYTNFYDSIPIGYFILNGNDSIVEVNQAGSDLLGIKKEELINKQFSKFIVSDYLATFLEYRALKDRPHQTCELKLLRWNGFSFYAELDMHVIKNTGKRGKKFLILAKETTDRKLINEKMKKIRAEMASVDRLRSMHELIAAVSHEQSHVLSVINNYIYGGIRRLETKKYHIDQLIEMMQKLGDQIHSLYKIIFRVNNAISKSILRFESSHINKLVNEVIPLIPYEIPDFPVKIDFELAVPLPIVKLDRSHIQQAILYLVRNAIEAMRDACIGEPKLLIKTALLSEHRVEIVVSDNGPGFAENIQHQLFDPHFTTKPYAVGLGLTVCRTIIEKHGGQVSVQLNPFGGASFSLTIPSRAITL